MRYVEWFKVHIKYINIQVQLLITWFYTHSMHYTAFTNAPQNVYSLRKNTMSASFAYLSCVCALRHAFA